MKNKFSIFTVLLSFVLFGLAMAAWAAPDAESLVVREVTPEGTFESTGTTYYENTYTKDTITNALADTLYLPTKMRPLLSDFVLAYSITRTSISGTASVAVKIEESTYRYTSATVPPTLGWAASLNTAGTAAATAATTATTEEIRVPNAFGTSYRAIITGAGTQSTSYTLRMVAKKKL